MGDGLRNTFEAFGVGRDVFELGDAELEEHVADSGVGAAEGR